MRFLHNNFYFARALPTIVIAVDSPAFGVYERALLRKIFSPSIRSLRHQRVDERLPGTSPFSRPLLIVADGAYKKVTQFCGIPHQHVDFVLGDLDSLKPDPDCISQVVDLVSDFVMPTSTAEIDHFLATKTCAAARDKKMPFILKVRDQNSSDFEKCLQFCVGLLKSANSSKKKVVSSSEADEHNDDSNFESDDLVLTIGGHGGEWHHEISVIHTAAKYSHQLPNIRLHSTYSTVMFAAPNGKTLFRKNNTYESHVFGVVPLGTPPTRIQTTGLKWNLDVDSSKQKGSFFGWANVPTRTPPASSASAEKQATYISTSNKMVADYIKIDLFQPDEQETNVVALTVNNKSSYVKDLLASDDEVASSLSRSKL